MSGKSTLRIEAELPRLAELRQFVESSAKSHGAEDHAISDLKLAVDEAVTNIVVHGYKGSPGAIEINVDRCGNALIVRLRDSAPQFDTCSYTGIDMGAPAERGAPGGFGIRLIRQVMDEVIYHARNSGGNELTLIKHFVSQ